MFREYSQIYFNDSIKNVPTFKHVQDTHSKIKIKIEIDTNPPVEIDKTSENVNFSMDFPVAAYDLKSCMSGKMHALLCRPYRYLRRFKNEKNKFFLMFLKKS